MRLAGVLVEDFFEVAIEEGATLSDISLAFGSDGLWIHVPVRGEDGVRD
jgi:hypothetical protein